MTLRSSTDRHKTSDPVWGVDLLKARLILLLGVILVPAFLPLKVSGMPASAVASVPPCDQPGWFPTDFGLKDHHVFWYDGYYYLASIYLDPQDQFAYGRSTDLCQWEDIGPILTTRLPGSWDAMSIWAPFVYQEDGVFYMYYTGATFSLTQSIMLATTENPADPTSWQELGMIFQPNHPGMVWQAGQWADCRDPTVIKVGDVVYLYYTGTDTTGGIIGLATASSPAGPWTDLGSIIPPIVGGMPESPTVALFADSYYLFYNQTNAGERYQIGNSPAGPWQEAYPFTPGWAHEVWQNPEGEWYTSYLTWFTVTISPLTWDTLVRPIRPWIGTEVFHTFLPLFLR
jgi:predicted GH43/DUF377 family glycosyl hydrolase